MVVQTRGIEHFRGLLDRYLSCGVPKLTEAKTIACTHEIFLSIAQLDRGALLEGFAGERGLDELIAKIDGAQSFVRSFLPVFEAATFVINASVEPVDVPKLQEQIDTLLGLGLETFDHPDWKQFYQIVFEKLFELGSQIEESPPTTSADEAGPDIEAFGKALDSEQDDQVRIKREIHEAIASEYSGDEVGQLHEPSRFAEASTQTSLEPTSAPKERFACAHKAYFEEKDYAKVVRLLVNPETFDASCLLARALTKLGRFRDAHQQFDVGFKLAKYPAEKNLLLNRRAVAYLEEYKRDKKPPLFEGCITCLLGALSQGNSYYAALVVLDAFKSADLKVWKDLIRKKYKVHDLMWKCAALLCEDPRQVSSAFTLMSAFPMPSVTPFLNEKDFLKILSIQQRVDLPLAIFSGWHLLQKEAQPWSFESDVQVLAIYSRLRDSARLLLSNQLFFLSALYARNAWAQSHQVGFTFEATVLYASVLAQMGNFEELEKWGKTAWYYTEKRNSISFFYLMNAFCDHHHIGQQRTRIGASGNCSTIYTVTAEGVREEFRHAKMLFSDAGQDPYWRKILTHYFPGEDFSKRT